MRWTEKNEALQIAFVMLIFPLIMNAMQYYIIDIFIKKKAAPEGSTDDDHEDGARDAGSIGSSADEHGGLLAGHDDHDDSIDVYAENEARKKNPNVTTWKVGGKSKEGGSNSPREEYNPDTDGQHNDESSRDNLERGHEEDEDLLSKVPKPTE